MESDKNTRRFCVCENDRLNLFVDLEVVLEWIGTKQPCQDLHWQRVYTHAPKAKSYLESFCKVNWILKNVEWNDVRKITVSHLEGHLFPFRIRQTPPSGSQKTAYKKTRHRRRWNKVGSASKQSKTEKETSIIWHIWLSEVHSHKAKASLAFSSEIYHSGFQTGKAFFSKNRACFYFSQLRFTPSDLRLYSGGRGHIPVTCNRTTCRFKEWENSPCSCGSEEAPRPNRSLHLP